MADTIPNDGSTNVTVTVGGGSTISTIDTIGDHDWFRLDLTAGQTVTITLNGVTLSDPYLRIRDSSGALIKENDDYGSLNSQVSFVASYTGVYFIDVAAWADPQNPFQSYPGATGDYQLTVTAFQNPPIYNNDQIANQLTVGYWGDGSVHRFVLDGTRSLTVNLTELTPAGANLARQALQMWSDITGITFTETSSVNAKITFTDNDPENGAFTESTYDQNGNITTSHVNVDLSWLTRYGSNVGGYAYQAYLHEIGHALGLGHAGNYNTVADFPVDALYLNDAWNTSVMSYFSQTDNTYFSGQGFTDAHDVTPMVADILAMQQLYGLSTTTRSGDTTYGFNSNAGTPFDANTLSNVAFTIFDTGGTDTLDYSVYNFAQTINLNPETFSSIGGERGNVSIARGTVIENAIGGAKADTIIGNSVANVLSGTAGNDILTGGAGNDTFSDTRADHNGDTITDFSVGDKILFTDATLAGFSFSLVGSTLNYTGGSLTLSGSIGGTIVASAAPGGGVQLMIQQAIVQDARNDFNGDGRSDVLWRSDAGEFTNWLGQANGGFVGNGANTWYTNLPSSWQVIETGDFNGDGRDDLLWRSDSGEMTNWLGQANGGFVNNGANAWFTNLPSSWQVVGTGDFNGDGRDDLMWRSTSGEFSNWLGQANGGFVNNGANSWGVGPSSWKVIAVGDFNGDGRDDILWRSDAGEMSDWLGQANGGFVNNGANSWFANVPSSWQVVGTGDFNGDGRDDLMWRSTSGEFSNWLGQANGGFVNNGANSWGVGPTSWHIVGIGDYNGDGRDDLLWRSDAGEFSNWLANANGGFANNGANSWSVGPTSWHVVQTDTFWV